MVHNLARLKMRLQAFWFLVCLFIFPFSTMLAETNVASTLSWEISFMIQKPGFLRYYQNTYLPFLFLLSKKNHSRPFQNFSTDKFNCRRGNRSFCFRILKHQSSSFSVLLMCTSIGNIPLSFMKELFMKKSKINSKHTFNLKKALS